MSMSTHVVGFRPPDEKWKKMKAAWDTCMEAGVNPPAEVLTFFNHSEPDDSGVEINLERIKGAVIPWSNEDAAGLAVDLTKIPTGLTIIRFYNSW